MSQLDDSSPDLQTVDLTRSHQVTKKFPKSKHHSRIQSTPYIEYHDP